MDYRNTLNLPQTDFSMKANLAFLEPQLLAEWKKKNIYALLLAARQKSPLYVLHDGPPYANGVIHIGHALNKILKDIVLKYKTLQGFRSPYIPGWDCHGLPIEHQLLKDFKGNPVLNQIEFRAKAAEFALKYVGLQRDDFERLGIFGDWQNPYLTLNSEYEAGILTVLAELFQKGFIKRGFKPVHWCMHCKTALAEAEIEYADKSSPSIYVKFKVTDKKQFSLIKENLFFLVWTTTPWTLLSNVAVAIKEDLTYSLVKIGSEVFIMLSSLVGTVLQKSGLTEYTVMQEIAGKDLEGCVCRHPFLSRDSRVISASFVSSEDGTGCVHIAPGHGLEDFEAGLQHRLEVIMPVLENGTFHATEKFSGQNVHAVNPLILEEMKANHTLFHDEKIVHSYPHCWRCKQPTIFRATKQWFFDVDHQGLRKKIIEEIGNSHWIPTQGQERISSMVDLRPSWCISRQRLWGVPIPSLKCSECGDEFLDYQLLQAVIRKVKEYGSTFWFSTDIQEFIQGDYSCPFCKSKKLAKGSDILDVWFESGASFRSVLRAHPELIFPADLYLEGSDQHRGWFQLSLILSVALEHKAPFKKVLTHGFVVDGEGKKMSKSMGNVVSPQDVIKKYGAEILRLWAFSSDYHDDIKLSDGIIQQLVDSYRKIRNTLKFILGNLHDFDIEKDRVVPEKLDELDRYVLSLLSGLETQVKTSYDDFGFYKAYQALYNFCNLTLSSFYLDILKDRLYTYAASSSARRSSQTVLWHIADFLIKAIAPFLSFTAEQAYGYFQTRSKKPTVFLEDWPALEQFRNQALETRWNSIVELRERALKVLEEKRAEGLLGSSLEAEITVICSNEEAYKLYSSSKDIVREVCIVSGVEVIRDTHDTITVARARGKKCPRCWNWREDTDTQTEFPGLCSRCVQALKTQKVDNKEAL